MSRFDQENDHRKTHRKWTYRIRDDDATEAIGRCGLSVGRYLQNRHLHFDNIEVESDWTYLFNIVRWNVARLAVLFI